MHSKRWPRVNRSAFERCRTHLVGGKGLVLAWPKKCKLAHVFRRECSYKRLKLAQLLGQLGLSFVGPSQAPNGKSEVGRKGQLQPLVL
jgi:hypothetical protein